MDVDERWELTGAIAWENGSSTSNRALRMPVQGLWRSSYAAAWPSPGQV